MNQQQYVPQLKVGKNKDLIGSGGSSTSSAVNKHKVDKARRHSRHPPRLRNIDRSSATTNEVTVNNVTVVITEYKPKIRKITTTSTATSSDQSGLSSSASSENGSQHDSNQDSRSLDISADV